VDLISVIVPVYKVEKYLDKCIESIVNQTYKNLEIILVDDGSPDNCGAICDVWATKDSRIKVIHKENGGLSDARNAGLAVATGDWVAFVDSDDWVAEEMFARLLNAAKNHQADISACNVQFVEEGQLPDAPYVSGETVCLTPKEAIRGLIQGGGVRAVAWNKLYKRQLLHGETFPIGKYHEDEFFTYRILAKAEKIVHIEDKFYFYLQRQGSIMQTFHYRRLDALDAYLERLAFLQDHYPDLYEEDKQTFCICCASFYRQVLRFCDDAAKYKEKIIQCRRKVRFSLKEIRRASTNAKFYILGTGCCMELFCRLQNWRNKGK
jgi:glycosyltransferase involved in cell wall biosynthesis